MLALAQLDVVPVARAALRAAAGIARHTSCKEELLAEGALQLLLQLLAGSLGLQPSSPRMQPLHFARQLHTRRLALMALANLCEAHLAVQATVVAHGALPQLVAPLRRHNAAAALAEAEAKPDAQAEAAASSAATAAPPVASTPRRGAAAGGAAAGGAEAPDLLDEVPWPHTTWKPPPPALAPPHAACTLTLTPQPASTPTLALGRCRGSTCCAASPT